MEWTVVTALAALTGLGAVIVKPIVSLTRSITELTVVVERVEQELAQQARRSQDSNRRLWAKNEEQDGRLDDHERRIDRLESRP
ncbi:MAG TPA: hypothetical protein H9841_04975 [Candidatus Flavonifractor merdigallinarum]|uniref:Uncharacterized protein n=1 Tax=Candidatus Flavonifractor merdigallinarum TaxID=2838589 RepID=A0A9D1Y7S5_9FIRM|nr:hypothetical protein [Candidatus Flavonifractor merdigallinarum]